MMIIEKDFRIENNGTAFILYLLKSKKELKIDKDNLVIVKESDEDHIDLYKIGGYFTKLEMAIWNGYKFRRNKKYAFKEPADPLKVYYRKYKNISESLLLFLTDMYSPISDLKEKLIHGLD